MNKIKYVEPFNTCYNFFLEGRGYIMIKKRKSNDFFFVILI